MIFGTDGLRELEATEPGRARPQSFSTSVSVLSRMSEVLTRKAAAGKCSGKKLWHGKKPKQSVEYEDVENDNNQGNNNEELKPKISRVVSSCSCWAGQCPDIMLRTPCWCDAWRV